jgi:hypothetical protein
LVGESVNTYRGRGNGWSGNRHHFSPGRGIGNLGIGRRSNLDRGINTAPNHDECLLCSESCFYHAGWCYSERHHAECRGAIKNYGGWIL